MNTMIGYGLEREEDKSGKALQALLLLVKNFMSQDDSGIQSRYAWHSQDLAGNVPARVWKRHSALLSMLVEQAESHEVQQNIAD